MSEKSYCDMIVPENPGGSAISADDVSPLLSFAKIIPDIAQGKHAFGLAAHAGTYTLSVSLCDLARKIEVASACVPNEQTAFANSPAARAAGEGDSAQETLFLRGALLDSLRKAVAECMRISGVDKKSILGGVCVLAQELQTLFFPPPEHALKDGVYGLAAADLNLDLAQGAELFFIAVAGTALGTDVAAQIMSLRRAYGKGRNIILELGADGRVIVDASDQEVAVIPIPSPVFEGCMLRCGMIAKSGAIEWFRMEKGATKLLSIGHICPLGICGTGIIDLISELLNNQIIDASGRLTKDPFLVYKDKGECLELTQDDLRAIQLNKAAVRAVLDFAMRALKLEFSQVERLFVCGALGEYLNTDNLKRIGLVPENLSSKIRFAGNRSFLGAKQILLSAEFLAGLLELKKQLRLVPVVEDEIMEKDFVQALKFPK